MGIFEPLPKDITSLSDKEVNDALAEREELVGRIDADDAELLGELSADEVLAELATGVDQIAALNAEVDGRAEAKDNFVSAKAELLAKVKAPVKAEAEEEEGEEAEGDEAEGDEAEASVETVEEEPEVEAPAEEKELVLASAETEPEKRMLRPLPAPAEDRVVVNEPETKALSFVASGLLPVTPPGKPLETMEALTAAIIEKGKSLGSPTKFSGGREEHFQVAHLDYSANFPEERTLRVGDVRGNGDKVKALGTPFWDRETFMAVTASGGICAPAENIYSIPQPAVQDRPVRDGLPSMRAERGAINVPVPGIVGDVAGAITVITEAEDALGGTFATKACLDLTCPSFNETAVTVIAHCREFGNLNAFSWPELIANQNELTMAEHARIAEGFLLGQIKAQSIHVSSGAETLGAIVYLMDAITKSQFGIRSRLRLPNEARFQAFLPRVTLDILLLDTIQTSFDSYRTRGDIEAYLNSVGVDVTWYMDTPLLSTGQGLDGPSMIGDAAQGDQAALEAFPDVIQWALFPAGTFLHIDMAELNLGIVRDSTLNSTNDFQIFGETFENVARIGPPQAAYWETTDICANGMRAPAGTARTCD